MCFSHKFDDNRSREKTSIQQNNFLVILLAINLPCWPKPLKPQSFLVFWWAMRLFIFLCCSLYLSCFSLMANETKSIGQVPLLQKTETFLSAISTSSIPPKKLTVIKAKLYLRKARLQKLGENLISHLVHQFHCLTQNIGRTVSLPLHRSNFYYPYIFSYLYPKHTFW
jgi:hypothetical protein